MTQAVQFILLNDSLITITDCKDVEKSATHRAAAQAPESPCG